MRAREFLGRCRHIDQKIEARIEERRRLQETLTRGVGRLNGMPRGERRDWTDAAAKVADLDREIARQISRLCQVKEETWHVIDLVDEGELRRLLELRYRSGYTWRLVAREMNYDESSCYRLYKKALKAVDEILNED